MVHIYPSINSTYSIRRSGFFKALYPMSRSLDGIVSYLTDVVGSILRSGLETQRCAQSDLSAS